MKTKFIFPVLLSLASILPVQSRAQSNPDNYAFCQVRLLKAATDGLVKSFPEIGKYVWEIRDITYNYNLQGKARVIFISSHSKNPNDVCIIDAVTLIGAEKDGICPEYNFVEARTTCK